MRKGKIEFVILVERGSTIQETLAMVGEIQKDHPNATIRVEVKV